MSQHGEGLFDQVMGSYNHLMVELRDPRVDNWLLMSSIWPTTFICIAYLFIVKVLGPKFMENREAYDIKGILIVYNLFQTLFIFWMFKEGWTFFVTGRYSLHCEPVDYSNNPDSRRALSLCWWSFFSKLIDLLDTIFFISRKKFSQISFLHVIHHSTLPFLSWWGPRFVGGGHWGFAPFLNSGVHTVMYIYYLLSALGPKFQKYLWWKRYIPILQLVKFVIIYFHAIQPIFFECEYPRPASILFAVSGLQYFILFTAFYKKKYKKASLGKIKKNSIRVVPPMISNAQLKEEDKLSGKREKED